MVEQREATGEQEDAHEGERLRRQLVCPSLLMRPGGFPSELTIIQSLLRPLVSMRNSVGIVATTWIAPYPREAYRASVAL